MCNGVIIMAQHLFVFYAKIYKNKTVLVDDTSIKHEFMIAVEL